MTQSNDDFASYLAARRDYNCYLEAKGYYYDGDRLVWHPNDWTDEEPLETTHPPGACRRGELDDYDSSDCEEF